MAAACFFLSSFLSFLFPFAILLREIRVRRFFAKLEFSPTRFADFSVIERTIVRTRLTRMQRMYKNRTNSQFSSRETCKDS